MPPRDSFVVPVQGGNPPCTLTGTTARQETSAMVLVTLPQAQSAFLWAGLTGTIALLAVGTPIRAPQGCGVLPPARH